MRRVWCTLGLGAALVATGARPAVAQWAVGVSAGPTVNVIDGRPVEERGRRWGGLAGGFAEYRLDQRWAFKFEGNFAWRGSENVVLENGAMVSSVSLTYFEFPTMLVLLVPVGSALDLGMYGGVALSFTVTCHYRVGPDFTSKCDGAPIGGSLGDATIAQWSLPLGTELRWRVPSLGSAFVMDARLQLGVSYAFENSFARNRSAALLARWVYYLGG